jgi:hypothetical protein
MNNKKKVHIKKKMKQKGGREGGILSVCVKKKKEGVEIFK